MTTFWLKCNSDLKKSSKGKIISKGFHSPVSIWLKILHTFTSVNKTAATLFSYWWGFYMTEAIKFSVTAKRNHISFTLSDVLLPLSLASTDHPILRL